jgi:hypothetical protein
VLRDSEAMQIATVPTRSSHAESALAASRKSAAQHQDHEAQVRESEATQNASVQARVVDLLQKNMDRPVLVVFRKKPKLQSENRVTDPPPGHVSAAVIAS